LDLGPTLVIKEAAVLGGKAATSATDRSSGGRGRDGFGSH